MQTTSTSQSTSKPMHRLREHGITLEILTADDGHALLVADSTTFVTRRTHAYSGPQADFMQWFEDEIDDGRGTLSARYDAAVNAEIDLEECQRTLRKLVLAHAEIELRHAYNEVRRLEALVDLYQSEYDEVSDKF